MEQNFYQTDIRDKVIEEKSTDNSNKEVKEEYKFNYDTVIFRDFALSEEITTEDEIKLNKKALETKCM